MNAFDDDLRCPICLDLMVGVQMLNPCKHLACGACSEQWIAQKATPTCPMCREPVNRARALLPAPKVDDAVRKALGVLEASGEAEWAREGAKRADWERRMTAWTAAKNRETLLDEIFASNGGSDVDARLIQAILEADGQGVSASESERLAEEEQERIRQRDAERQGRVDRRVLLEQIMAASGGEAVDSLLIQAILEGD